MPILIGENGAVVQVGVELPPKEQYVLPYSSLAKDSLAIVKKEIDARIPDIWYQPNLVGVTPFPKSDAEFEVIEEVLDEKKNVLRDVKIYRHADCFDIVPEGIDKKEGVHFAAQQMHVLPDEIIAVGDAINDYPMFAYAKTALGVNVKDEDVVDKNFNTITEALEFLYNLCSENNKAETYQ